MHEQHLRPNQYAKTSLCIYTFIHTCARARAHTQTHTLELRFWSDTQDMILVWTFRRYAYTLASAHTHTHNRTRTHTHVHTYWLTHTHVELRLEQLPHRPRRAYNIIYIYIYIYKQSSHPSRPPTHARACMHLRTREGCCTEWHMMILERCWKENEQLFGDCTKHIPRLIHGIYRVEYTC